MANGNNATIGFEKQIWDAACVLWGHIPAAEYRKVIVGLIFLRYISNAFEKRYQELVAEGDGFEDDRDAYAEDNIFFVPEDARWSKIASAAHTPEIGTLIDNAMRAIEAENKSLKNVLPKNYASPDLDKRVLGDVVDLFTNMDMSDTKENKDLLGKTYQYCIQQFAAWSFMLICCKMPWTAPRSSCLLTATILMISFTASLPSVRSFCGKSLSTLKAESI